MTSKPDEPKEAFVWIWLPGEVKPVVAGRVAREGKTYLFNYGQSYLRRDEALAVFAPELPLRAGAIEPNPPLTMANCLRDASPDAWGRRVIINRLTGSKGTEAKTIEFDELTYMLQSGSDRVGALDFQASPEVYTPREEKQATLEDLQEAAEKVQRGEPIPDALDRALFHGSSIGGARPKALIETQDRKFIAKFSASNDTYAVVKAEFLAMRLARRANIDVAAVELASASGKDVLLVERFDRVKTSKGWTRKAMVSALTILGLDEISGHHASYSEIGDAIRKDFTDPQATLRELFARMVFNILAGNWDDHARNHAAFWDGQLLTLTPAYDVCPGARNSRETNQAIAIDGTEKRSQVVHCVAAASRFLLSKDEARQIIDRQIGVISDGWQDACDEARLGAVDRAFLWQRQFLNEYALQGYR